MISSGPRLVRFWVLGALILISLFWASCVKSTGTISSAMPAVPTGPTILATPISSADSAKGSIIQVGESADQPEAFGIVVGDGSQILTVINYESYNPGELAVILPGQDTYSASIQGIDPRDGATLLKLDSVKLSPATIGNANTVSANQELFIRGWTGPNMAFDTTPVVLNKSLDLSPLAFNVQLSEIQFPQALHAEYYQGAVVTDKEGRVLGLESIFAYGLVGRLSYVGYVPPIISINSALGLLSPESSRQPWANGPLLFSVTGKNGLSRNYDGFVNNYAGIADAIRGLLTQLGQSLSTDDIPQNYPTYFPPNGSQDGTLLTTVFPRPVELRDDTGVILAQAKWIGIQWGRTDGNPNRIIYGTTTFNVSGAFELNGDTTNLENIIKTQVDHPYGP